MQERESSFACLVLVVTPQGVVAVREPNKPPPIYWKLPGGIGEEDETPKKCAVRELEEETGITVSSEQLTCFFREELRTHTRYFFRAQLSKLPPMAKQGLEGEETGVLSPREILEGKNFLPSHLLVVRRIIEAL